MAGGNTTNSLPAPVYVINALIATSISGPSKRIPSEASTLPCFLNI